MIKASKFECPSRLILKILEILNTFALLISLIFRYEGVRYRTSSAKVCLRDLACIFGYLNSRKTLKYILRFAFTRKKTRNLLSLCFYQYLQCWIPANCFKSLQKM